MSEVPGGESDAKPNLTPILDMVFQLITFFMLVINFKSASLDLSLKLPVVGSARPVDTKGQSELLVLNIDTSGQIKLYGNVKRVDEYIREEARISRMAARRNDPSFDDEKEKKEGFSTTVVIRADRTTKFTLLNKVIKACQDNGFRKFALKAMNKES